MLNEVEVRVIGSLLEKELTTPEYYPLTLNALTHACNQLSNRDPVVSFDEKTVVRALDGLRDKKLVHVVFASDSRVPKYRQVLTESLNLTPPEVAVICVLLLRGPQTVGEIRGRTNRLYEFAELTEVETTLQRLMTREPQPLVTKLPRQTGRKESRYAHLLAGEISIEERESAPRLEPATLEVRAENERIAGLEDEVRRLRQEVSELRQQFDDFKKQFE
jgi:uncharacterized protein YceH (UPF0502 family)